MKQQPHSRILRSAGKIKSDSRQRPPAPQPPPPPPPHPFLWRFQRCRLRMKPKGKEGRQRGERLPPKLRLFRGNFCLSLSLSLVTNDSDTLRSAKRRRLPHPTRKGELHAATQQTHRLAPPSRSESKQTSPNNSFLTAAAVGVSLWGLHMQLEKEIGGAGKKREGDR